MGEQCDDNNTTDNDGCSSTCTVESSYTCTGTPSVCTLDNGSQCATDSECTSGVCDLNESPSVCEAADVCGNGKTET